MFAAAVKPEDAQMTWVEKVRLLHIAAGFTALALFWLPMVARKGGRLHRRAGWIYVGAMGVVAVTAVVVCGERIFFEGPEVRARSLFLLFISILAASAAATGVRALREKRRTGATRKIINLGLPALLFASGLAISVYGFYRAAPLFVIFGILGVVSGGSQLFYWLRPPQSRMHWWFSHMIGMVGSSVATLTAFVVVNAPRLGLSSFSIVPWVAPGVLGVLGLRIWIRYYKKKFAARERPAPYVPSMRPAQ